MSDGDLSESVKTGSNNLVEGVGLVKHGVHHLLRSLTMWLDRHRILKWVILTPVSALIGNFSIRALTQGYIYFFGATVPINRDVKVSVFPAPIGFTLWILSTGFVLFGILSYIRFVTLRQQVDDLEKQIQS